MQWQVVLLLAAGIVAVIGRREPRCLMWLAAGAASFMASKTLVLSGAEGLSLALGNAVGDGLVLLAIAQARRYAWERRLYHVFLLMLLCHAAVASHLMPAAFPDGTLLIAGEPVYASILEALNLAAIVIIGRAGWEARNHAGSRRAYAHRSRAGLRLARRDVSTQWETWR